MFRLRTIPICFHLGVLFLVANPFGVKTWSQTTDPPVSPIIGQKGIGNNPLLPKPRTRVQEEIDPRPVSQVQSGFPQELILRPPSQSSLQQANQLVTGTIDPEIPLNLVIGRPKVLQLAKAPKRIYVPSEDIIRTEIIDKQSGKEVAITGLEAGTTTLILWFDDPTQPSGQSTVSYLVRVFADPILARPIEELSRELNLKFPNSYVELDQIEDRMIVRGQAPNAIEMAQILQILSGARGVQSEIETPATVTTAFNFQGDVDPLQAQEQAAARRRLVDPIALARAGIINQMTVIGEHQVMLKVTVAEVNRTAARSIGLNFAVDNNAGVTIFQSLAGNLAQSTASQSTANILASLDMGQIRVAIEALRRLNLSRTLAEPTLVAMNGESADFQAGGRFPVPVISSGGAGQNLQGVNFIPFGVQLEFTPIVESNGVIRLQVNAEVSTRDESLGTSIGGGTGGTQVSGLNSRNFSTTVQLKTGQTIAVAGLMQTNYGASTDRIPLWGDLPILGSTGGVNRNSSGEQELVVLITPHLVSPIDRCVGPALPGSDVHEPTDIEFFIANRLESRRSRDYRTSVQTDLDRQKTAERCQVQSFMIGNIGPTDRCNCGVGTASPIHQNPAQVPIIESQNLPNRASSRNPGVFK